MLRQLGLVALMALLTVGAVLLGDAALEQTNKNLRAAAAMMALGCVGAAAIACGKALERRRR